MGLNALDPADWLWRDEHFAAETAQRRAVLIATRPAEVLAMLPGAEPAARELVAMVRAHLGAITAASRHAGRVAAARRPWPAGAGGFLRHAGAAADGRLCPDRGAALLPGPLAAGREARPAAGRRSTRRCRGFNARLGGAGRPVLRQPRGGAAGLAGELVGGREPGAIPPAAARAGLPDLTAENAGEQLWLRVERQTLRRLPETGAVVFTIRTLRPAPGRGRAPSPASPAAMAARIREMEPGMAGYKGIPALREPLLGLSRRPWRSSTPALRRQGGAGQRAVLQPGRALARHDDVGRGRRAKP